MTRNAHFLTDCRTPAHFRSTQTDTLDRRFCKLFCSPIRTDQNNCRMKHVRGGYEDREKTHIADNHPSVENIRSSDGRHICSHT